MRLRSLAQLSQQLIDLVASLNAKIDLVNGKVDRMWNEFLRHGAAGTLPSSPPSSDGGVGGEGMSSPPTHGPNKRPSVDWGSQFDHDDEGDEEEEDDEDDVNGDDGEEKNTTGSHSSSSSSSPHRRPRRRPPAAPADDDEEEGPFPNLAQAQVRVSHRPRGPAPPSHTHICAHVARPPPTCSNTSTTNNNTRPRRRNCARRSAPAISPR
jgi:hypothetical protein